MLLRFSKREKTLGGMMRYGIPNYRTPRDILDAEIKRILDLGDIEVVLIKESGKIYQWMKWKTLMMQFCGL
jgi:NADPH-dependent glutamate synthase beta subunit-like oxidoreductase